MMMVILAMLLMLKKFVSTSTPAACNRFLRFHIDYVFHVNDVGHIGNVVDVDKVGL